MPWLRRPALATATLMLATACSGGQPTGSSATAPLTTATTPSASAVVSDLATYAGVYRTATGTTYLLTRSALFVNTTDASVHSVSLDDRGQMALGPSFGVPSPAAGDVVFSDASAAGMPPSGLIVHWAAGGSVSAGRVPTTQENVRIASGDVQLAATLTRPAHAGRLPAIAIVHGSGRETRALLDLWTQLYASLGLAVLTYDKRGVGESTGTYPGDLASVGTLQLLATDAEAVVTYLRSRTDIDAAHVALHGGSQGGWVVPIADAVVHPAFSIIASGPPLTTGQQSLYASLSSNGRSIPTQSDADIDGQLAAETGGYDPAPVLAADGTPTLWIFGAADLHVPVRLAVANLTHLHRPNFTWRVLPRAGHSLLETGSGLDKDDDTATKFGAELFGSITSWVQQSHV